MSTVFAVRQRSRAFSAAADYGSRFALAVVLFERAHHELGDQVDLRLGRGLVLVVGMGAAEHESQVRQHRAHRRHDGHETGHGHGGHGAEHGHQGGQQRDLDDILEIQRLELADHETDDGADDLLRCADRLEQTGHPQFQ